MRGKKEKKCTQIFEWKSLGKRTEFIYCFKFGAIVNVICFDYFSLIAFIMT